MRPTLPLLPLLLPMMLGGCQALAPVAVVGGATVAAIGRSPVDLVVSYATGRDCSVVRLDRRESYCAQAEQAPRTEPFCTMSLGRADCWIVPPLAFPAHLPVGDGARTLNAAQEADRTRFGPGITLPQVAVAVEPVPLAVVVPVPVAAEAPPVMMEPVDTAPVPPRTRRGR
ncbi:MAG: hypothetical protein V4653_00360 [Pseudomonadota bacterium]